MAGIGAAFKKREESAEDERKAVLPSKISIIGENLLPHSEVFAVLGAALLAPVSPVYSTAIRAGKALERTFNNEKLHAESNPSPAPAALLYTLEFLGIKSTKDVAESNPSPAPRYKS
ncbi:MAG: hypothetical protein AABW86_05635 [Candidatus Micrarchaeota archaeon]